MIRKENVKMYIKQKSSITAFLVIFVFFVCLLITFLPSVQYKKGVTDEFKNYDISFVTTNNYSVTYLVSEDNYLFFSQNKKQDSSLNDFAGIKDYSNEYGDPTTNLYNFIKIDYQFPNKIVDVQGIYDDMNGDKGETFVLTNNNNLYIISQRSNSVQLFLKDVLKYKVKYDKSTNKEMYLILDTNNILSLYYFDNNKLKKHDIYEGFVDDFYYINNDGKDNILINKNNNLIKLSLDIYKNNSIEYENAIAYSYPILQAKNELDKIENNLNVSVDKIVEINDKYYYLKNNRVHLLDINNPNNTKAISFEKQILDIYPTGEDACIAICDDGLYYLGVLEDYQTNYDTFTYLNIKEGLIYGNRNSVILLDKNNKLYLNKDGKYEGMYKNVFTTIILRYASIFVLVMMIFYIVLSFIEDNKRYNRYFKYHNN